MVIIDTATFDVLHDLMDMQQRQGKLLAALCEKAGIDPAEACRLPDDPPGNAP